MNNTTILMAITFFSLFFTFMIYNYITTLVNAGTFSSAETSCLDFTNTINMFEHPSFSIPKAETLKDFNTNENKGISGIITNILGLPTFDALRGFYNFLVGIWNYISNMIASVVNFVGWLGGIGASFIVIFTTECPSMVALKWILGIFFFPMIIGLVYIIIRLVKSMIPTVGGD